MSAKRKSPSRSSAIPKAEKSATPTGATPTSATPTNPVGSAGAASAQATTKVAPAQPIKVEGAEAKSASPAAPSAAGQKLLNELSSDQQSTRLSAINALGKLGEKAAVPSLIGLLSDSDADVARDAATALGAIGDASANEPLHAVLRNAEGYHHVVVRGAAAASLANLAHHANAAQGDAAARAQRHGQTVTALLNAIDDSSAEASVEAVRAAARFEDVSVASKLVSIVENHNGYYAPTVRHAAIVALRTWKSHATNAASPIGQKATAVLSQVASDENESPTLRAASQA